MAELKAPKFNKKKSSNTLQLLILRDMLSREKKQEESDISLAKAEKERESAKSNIQDFISKQDTFKNVQPGATINIGENVSANIPLNRKYTVDETRQMGMADAFNIHVRVLQDMQKDPDNFRDAFSKATIRLPGNDKIGEIFGISTTFGNKESQLVKFRLKDMADRLLRLRSGAQINEREFQRLTGLLPTFEDISDVEDVNFEVINTKLNTFLNEFENTRQRLLQGQSFDENGSLLQYNQAFWGFSNPINAGLSGGVNRPTPILISRNGVQGEIDSMDEFDETTDKLLE